MQKLIFMAAVFLAGCAAPPLSDKAARVQLHEQASTLLGDCKKVGPVFAAGENGWEPGGGYPKARAMLREKTADLGGDSVAVLSTSESMTGTVTMQGVAFKCY